MILAKNSDIDRKPWLKLLIGIESCPSLSENGWSKSTLAVARGCTTEEEEEDEEYSLQEKPTGT